MNGFCCATSSRIQCCKRIIRNWKKLNGGTHHANPDDNYCNAGRYWRNRSRQRGSSCSVVRRVLPLPSPSLLRLLPVSSLPSLLAPLAPLVLALAGGPNSKAVGDTRQRLCLRPPYVPFSWTASCGLSKPGGEVMRASPSSPSRPFRRRRGRPSPTRAG